MSCDNNDCGTCINLDTCICDTCTNNEALHLGDRYERATPEMIAEREAKERKMIVERQIKKYCDTILDKERAVEHVREQIHQTEKAIENARNILANREKIEAAVEREAVLSQEIAEHEKKAQDYMKWSQEAQDLERNE